MRFKCSALLICAFVSADDTVIIDHASTKEEEWESSKGRMFDWFRQNGGTLHDGLEYRSEGGAGGGGMFATTHIAWNDVLCLIPTNLVYDPLQPDSSNAPLPSSPASSTESVLHMNEFELSLAAAKSLARALRRFNEKRASGGLASTVTSRDDFWEPYLASLPRECENPVCGLPLPDDIPVTPTRLFHRYAELYRQRVPPDDLLAYSLFRSRAWYPRVLVPVLDLFNHHPEYGNECETLESGDENDDDVWLPKQSISLRAGRDYAAGDEVWISYGKLTANAFHTLMHKNFVPFRSEASADGGRIFSEALMTLEDQQEDPSCDDMVYFRHEGFNVTRKVRCLSHASLDFDGVLAELQWAIGHRDLPTLKGLGGWLDRNIKSR